MHVYVVAQFGIWGFPWEFPNYTKITKGRVSNIHCIRTDCSQGNSSRAKLQWLLPMDKSERGKVIILLQ